MARMNQKFADRYLFGKMMEVIKPLNEIIDALDPTETELIARLKVVIKEITSIEF
jgi:hypothetical protein